MSTLNNTRRVQRSVEGAKQLFPKGCRIFIYSGPIKIKYKKLFPHLLLQQTSADAIVRFTNIKKDGDWKLSPMIKLLESEFLTHDKCYRKYTRWPKDEAVRSLKLQARNVNTQNYFFTISTNNNFIEIFWVKHIWVLKHHFWDTLVDQT